MNNLNHVDVKLPLSFQSSLVSNWRLRIPSWISFIEPKDTLTLLVFIKETDFTTRLERKVSDLRYIHLKSLEPYMPRDKHDSILKITILRVDKHIKTNEYFNFIAYRPSNGNYSLVYADSYVNENLKIQTQIIMETLLEKYFEEENEFYQDDTYFEQEKKWVITLVLRIDSGVYGLGKIPVFVFLILDHGLYTLYTHKKAQVDEITIRFREWLHLDDFIEEVIGFFVDDLKSIVFKDEQFSYRNISHLHQADKLQSRLQNVLLRSHGQGGIPYEDLVNSFVNEKEKIRKKDIDEALKQMLTSGIIIDYVNKKMDVRVIDTSWKI